MVSARNNNFRNTDGRERLNSFTRRLFLLITFRLASPLSSSGRSFILFILTIINEWNYIRVTHLEWSTQVRPYIRSVYSSNYPKTCCTNGILWLVFPFLIFIFSNFDFTTLQSCSCTHQSTTSKMIKSLVGNNSLLLSTFVQVKTELYCSIPNSNC